MCFTTAAYCFLMGFNTHFISQNITDNIYIFYWVFAYSSFYSYLKTVQSYLGRKIKFLVFSEYFCFIFCGIQIICAFSSIFFDYNFLFHNHGYIKSDLFAQAMHFHVSPNLFAKALGGIGALVVFYSCAVIWLELKKTNRKETLLRVGIITTSLAVINDSCLGLEITGAILPLYYFGNAFEAIRFNLFYRDRAAKQVYQLENEVMHLSKVAQFGFAAASIAHDIKNHLFVVKVAIDRIRKGREKNLNSGYELIAKHNDKITEITDLYMHLFKNNTMSEDQEVCVQDVIEDVKELLIHKFEEAGTRLEFDIDNFSFNSNQTEISICIVNLLKNALEEVTIEGKYENPWVKVVANAKDRTLDIVDCGSGVADKALNDLFKFGYSTKLSNGGHGIGLAISKRILDKAGYKLCVVPEAENTTFRIIL